MILARLTAIAPFDPAAPETAPIAAQLQSQFDGPGRRRRPDALHRGDPRAGGRDGQPGADRLHPRPLPVDAAPSRDRDLHRGLRRRPRTRWSGPASSPTSTRPVSLMLKLTEARKDSFLLESVTGGEVRGRYSIIGMKPDLIWECRGTRARLNRSARFDPDAWLDEAADPLASLRALIAESRIDLPADLPPMAAGLFGYLGYDMVRLVERLPDVNPDPLGLPDAVMIRPSVIARRRRRQGRGDRRQPRLGRLGPLGARRLCPGGRAGDGRGSRPRPRAGTDEPRPRRRVDAGRRRSRTRPTTATSRWSRRRRSTSRPATSSRSCPASAGRCPSPLPPFAIYRALRRVNPCPSCSTSTSATSS